MPQRDGTNNAQPDQVGPSETLKVEVRRHGKGILRSLAMAMRISRLYSFSHPHVMSVLKELEASLTAFCRTEESCCLSRMEDALFINKVRIKTDFGSSQGFAFLVDVMKAREIGEITFHEGIRRNDLDLLLALLSKPLAPQESPWDSFEPALKDTGFSSIEIRRYGEAEGLSRVDSEGELLTMGFYFKTIAILEGAFQAAKAEQQMKLRDLRHAVQTLVDMTLMDERILLSLVNIKDAGAPWANHAVNVALLAVALGAKLGLSKRLLSDLGLTSLLHDVGKAILSEHFLTTPRTSFSLEDAKLNDDHVFSGAEILLKERMGESLMRAVNVAFLHHYRFDKTGYPKLRTSTEQDLFTRIVAVADFYDNATTPRRLEEDARDAGQVLRAILDGSGTEFDPLVVKTFVNLMGLYPVGCIVRLDTGEVGTVVEQPSSSKHLDRPKVKLLLDRAGNDSDQLVNLLDREEDGRFARSILKLYQREQIQLNLGEYLAVL